MDFLLTLFDPQPRRVRVIEGVLTNKRTVTNLYWGRHYGLLTYLGAAHWLKRPAYDQWLAQQVAAGNLQLDEAGLFARLTPTGLARKQAWQEDHYRPRFGGWTWLVNQDRFAARFLLAFQLVSEFAHHQRHYQPLSLPFGERRRVRDWFLAQPAGINRAVAAELTPILAKLSESDEHLALLFTYRLIGHRTAGWAAPQAQAALGVTAADLPWLERDGWLFLASRLRHSRGPLGNLLAPLIADHPVAASAHQTLAAIRGGRPLEAVARTRHLKESTVREHLLQAALLAPREVDLARLLPPAIEQELHRRYPGPASSWHFAPQSAAAGREFYYFRLCQIKEENDALDPATPGPLWL